MGLWPDIGKPPARSFTAVLNAGVRKVADVRKIAGVGMAATRCEMVALRWDNNGTIRGIAGEILLVPLSPPMQIHLLNLGDESLLIEAARIFNADEEVSYERAASLLAEPTFFVVVARTDEGVIMGRIYGDVIHRFAQTDLLLYEVDVAEEHQRKGVARAMIEFVKGLAIQRGYKEIWVLTEGDNAPARALYKSLGGVEENSPTIMYVFYPRAK